MLERKYHFPGLTVQGAMIVQEAIDKRKDTLNLQDKTNKSIKACLDELDQIYADLNHHIATEVKNWDFQKTS
jgi:hypothetical protein